jgi:hypothetical protein
MGRPHGKDVCDRQTEEANIAHMVKRKHGSAQTRSLRGFNSPGGYHFTRQWCKATYWDLKSTGFGFDSRLPHQLNLFGS